MLTNRYVIGREVEPLQCETTVNYSVAREVLYRMARLGAVERINQSINNDVAMTLLSPGRQNDLRPNAFCFACRRHHTMDAGVPSPKSHERPKCSINP